MDPNTLRAAILRTINTQQATGTSEMLSDDKLATATGADNRDVQRQLDILESEGLVELAKTFGPTYAAWLTPKGMLAVEGLNAPPQPPPNPIGF